MVLRAPTLATCLAVGGLFVACAADDSARPPATLETPSSSAAAAAPTAPPSPSANCAQLTAEGQELESCGEPDPDAAKVLQAQASKEREYPLGPRKLALPPGHIYAKSRFVWVRPEPAYSKAWIGYLWLGGAVPLKGPEPVNGPGCVDKNGQSRWYAIQPRGFVCVDGKNATLDPKDPVLAATLPYSPRVDSPWPHAYGESRGAQKYKSIPTEELRRKREWDLAKHAAAVTLARAGTRAKTLEGVDLRPATRGPVLFPQLPSRLNQPRNRLRPMSTVAYMDEAHSEEGADFLLTADFTWVPKTRVVPYPKVTFKGVSLGTDARWPVAFVREKPRARFTKQGELLVAAAGEFPRLAQLELTGAAIEQDKVKYLETRKGGFWIREKDAVVPELRAPPWKQKDAPEGRQTWIEVNVWKGWLVAYEGKRPVYATLISPGRGGTPERGKPAIDTASTPTGTFKITGKFATATMVAPNEFVHSDVPWTQNFSGPHAMHGAYWHDNWGQRMSAGCINVSPRDGKWLYDFTEPKVPAGWHGLRWQPRFDPATTLVVR